MPHVASQLHPSNALTTAAAMSNSVTVSLPRKSGRLTSTWDLWRPPLAPAVRNSFDAAYCVAAGTAGAFCFLPLAPPRGFAGAAAGLSWPLAEGLRWRFLLGPGWLSSDASDSLSSSE